MKGIETVSREQARRCAKMERQSRRGAKENVYKKDERGKRLVDSFVTGEKAR
jgi:hypothetical protein